MVLKIIYGGGVHYFCIFEEKSGQMTAFIELYVHRSVK